MGQSLFKSQRPEKSAPSRVDHPVSPSSLSTSPPHTPTFQQLTAPEESKESPIISGQLLNTTPSPLSEVIFSEEELLNFLAPHPPDILPSQLSLFDGQRITVALMPHKHTLFCERKERVCNAVGKVQEQEILKVKGISGTTALEGCYWIRSLPNDSHSSYEFIEGSQNSERYVLTARDEKCFISFQQTTNGPCAEDGSTIVSHRASNSIGPVLPGPPRLLDLRIVGECVTGRRLYAEAEYIGGTQGLSEYWWFRIKAGKRVQISEPKAVSEGITLEDLRHTLATGETDGKPLDDDSRVLLLTEEDVGCVLKVKCRPVRVDGYKGEVFTSKASAVIAEANGEREVGEGVSESAQNP